MNRKRDRALRRLTIAAWAAAACLWVSSLVTAVVLLVLVLRSGL